MKYKLLLLSLLIIGCTKEPFEYEDSTPIGNPKPTIDFRNESYPSINNTVGNIERQKWNLHFSDYDFIWNEVTQRTNVDNYYPVYKASVQYDFFDDGKVDLLVFNAGGGEKIPGLYVLIEDVLEEDRTTTTFPSKLYSANSAVLSDTDGDGRNEMLLFGENSHNNSEFGGANNYLETGYRIFFDSNKNIVEQNIGSVPIGVHDVTSGDIDNDGDIDIVVFPTGVNQATVTPNFYFPLKLINDGFGNFVEQPFFSDESLITSKYGFNEWLATTFHLFDVNNDGYLDLVGGHYIGTLDPRWGDEFIKDKKDLTFAGIFISYGTSSGDYYYEQVGYFSESALSDKTQILYGLTFTDYDNDNDYDIVMSTYEVDTNGSFNLDSDSYIVHLLKNDNNNFVNVTESVIDGFSDLSGTTFSNFYRPIINDVDNDGDFDIVATAYRYHSNTITYPKLLYWEKNGNGYVKKEIY